MQRRLVLASVAVCLACAQSTPTNPIPDAVLREPGLVANLYLSREPRSSPGPGVVVLGGSRGGTRAADYYGRMLADRGYVALAVAYFGMEGLPDRLEEIPLEPIARALRWLGDHPATEPDRIGLVGGSRGGELALLVASRETGIRAVAVAVPSAVVWQSSASVDPPAWMFWRRRRSPRSSWTAGGEPLPFLQRRWRDHGAFRDGGPEVERATIPVERMNASLLLLSAKADEVWPSEAMCDAIVERLRRSRFPHPVEHYTFPGGHALPSGEMIDRIARFLEAHL